WEVEGKDDAATPGSTGVFARRFKNSPYPSTVFFLVQPAPRGAEYQVNAYTTGSQSAPAFALAEDGRFVVAWESEGQDGSGDAAVLKQFQFPPPVKMNIDETAGTGGTSNLNGVLESGEQVRVDPTWRNRTNVYLPVTGSADNILSAGTAALHIPDALADYGAI